MSKGNDMSTKAKRILGYAVIILPIVFVALKWRSDMGYLILSIIGVFNCLIFDEKILPHL